MTIIYGVLPTSRRPLGQPERKQDESESSSDEEQPGDVDLLGEVEEDLEGRSGCGLVGSGELGRLLCLPLTPKERQDDGKEADGDDDRKHSVTPSPGAALGSAGEEGDGVDLSVSDDLLCDLGGDEGAAVKRLTVSD